MLLEETIKILEMQEELLQFSHFTNEDAWELGNLMVAEAARNRLPIAISIRMNSGYTLFQYAFKGTSYNNEQWMTRKHNTVRTMEMSSLRLTMRLKKNGEELEDRGLNQVDYVARGGGFPIRVAGVGVIGSVLVSGLYHMADHDFAVACISQYLRIDEIPRLEAHFR
ncbi:MAG: heme-degrading domain-containing protein [Clostridiales bacterium]|nr:heme-degrading domain-containing protein [Clostridiales bacterium]